MAVKRIRHRILCLDLALVLSAVLAPDLRAGIYTDNPDLPPPLAEWRQAYQLMPGTTVYYSGSTIYEGELITVTVELTDIRANEFYNITQTTDGDDLIVEFDGWIWAEIVQFLVNDEPQAPPGQQFGTENLHMRVRIKDKADLVTGTFDLVVEEFTVIFWGYTEENPDETIEVIRLRNTPELDSTGWITIVDLGEGQYWMGSRLNIYTEGRVTVLETIFHPDQHAPAEEMLVWNNPMGNLNTDFWLNLKDLAIFAAQWLRTDCTPYNHWCANADVNEDGAVNLADLYIMMIGWIKD
ncbi:MAG: hypothetical protein JW810_06140 [Sedimentisphaerales bacterium]|nr:hypothetical protein [Sedimentisphaerales bacterium]